MIKLTDEQARELAQPEPLAIDPRTRQAYVLVRQETYERLKALLALDDYDPDQGAALMNEVMAEDDAGDPLLESYQHYGKQARSAVTSSSCLSRFRTAREIKSGQPWSCNAT